MGFRGAYALTMRELYEPAGSMSSEVVVCLNARCKTAAVRGGETVNTTRTGESGTWPESTRKMSHPVTVPSSGILCHYNEN